MSAEKLAAAAHEAGAEKAARPRVRDRIFDTACELFYRHGIRAVGVDAIATEAGTNKMSFYRSFPSKDDLVVEYLREQEREYFEWWDAAVGAIDDDARARIEALFQAQVDVVMESDCRGCALGNAAVEMPNGDDAVSQVVRGYKREVRARLHALARAAHARDPEQLGDALLLLMEGAYFTRLVFPCVNGPLAGLMPAVRALLDAHLPKRANAEERTSGSS